VKNLTKRLAAMPGDPWKPFDKGRRKVTPAMFDAVGYAASK